jgi:aminomethyltransferase
MSAHGDLTMRGTPFHEQSTKYNTTRWWYAWDHYLVPDMFTDVEEELRAIRSSAAIIDMSPLPKSDISGRDAGRLVDLLITRDASKMEIGHAIYTPFCAESGHVVSDGLVMRIASDRYRVSGDSAFEWFAMHARGFEVEVKDVTDDIGILSIQGPFSFATLARVTGQSWDDFKFSRIRNARVAGADVEVVRQGFTGELGVELWVRRQDGGKIWESVRQAGKEFDLLPAGEYAADVARMEAGIILIRTDYTGCGPTLPYAHGVLDPANVVTPAEIGLGRLVDFSKRAFLGKAALVAERDNGGPARGFTGLMFDSEEIFRLHRHAGARPNLCPRVRWDAMRLGHDGDWVGRATSVTWSPTLGAIIGFGCLRRDLIAEGREDIRVEWKDEAGRVLGVVSTRQVPTPFTALKRSH